MMNEETAIPNHVDAGVLTLFRFRLIQLLAGKSVVMLNARLQVAEATPDACAEIIGVNGLLARNCHFPVEHGYMVRVTQNGRAAGGGK